MVKFKKKGVMGIDSATPVMSWNIGDLEHRTRTDRVREELERRELDGLVVFHPIRMAYLTGFFHITTERPMAVVVSREGGVGALVPHLEDEHIRGAVGVADVEVYPEYPSGGGRHPMMHLADLLKRMKLNGKNMRLGCDNNGYHDVEGYNGPLLSEVVAGWVEVVDARDIVDRLRAVKSPDEIRLMRESCIWANLAHRIMHESIEPGRSTMAIGIASSAKASEAMVAALGPTYKPLTSGWFPMPANVVFSAGANTSMPHGLGVAAGIREGDVLVTAAGADVGGYQSELERTMFVGEPGKKFTKHFWIMMQLQQAACDAIRPGRTFAEVETEISKLHEDLGVADMQRHHTGHGLGLEGHEWPFIDKGLDDEIQVNMILSVEPGIYVPGLAGFRHSDTVLVTENGVELLTFYPRDLADLTVDV